VVDRTVLRVLQVLERGVGEVGNLVVVARQHNRVAREVPDFPYWSR